MAKAKRAFSLKDNRLLEGIEPPQPKKGRVVSLFHPTVEGLPKREQTLDRLSNDLTVCPSIGQTPDQKPSGQGTDGHTHVNTGQTVMPLAPLQWEIWQLLQELEGELLSYNGLSERSSGKLEGVKKAIRTLRKLGGIQTFTIEKSRTGQGFRIVLNREQKFQRVDLDTSKGIKRSKNREQTV